MADFLNLGAVQGDIQKAFLRMCRRRVWKKNKNLNILVLGESGSGKSYIGLKLGECLNQDFNIERVIFDNRKFIDLIDELKKGDVIILEELGINAYNRQWHSYVNQALDQIFQTFRHKNLITICNVPDKSFIDTHLRDQFHLIIWAKGVNYDKKLAITKIYAQKRNVLLGKTYYARLPITLNGITYKLRGINFGLPSQKLCKQYEDIMEEWKTDLRDKFKKNIEIQSGYQKRKHYSFDEIKEAYLKNPREFQKYIKTYKVYRIEKPLLKQAFNLTHAQSRAVEQKLLLEPNVVESLKPKEKPKKYYEI